PRLPGLRTDLHRRRRGPPGRHGTGRPAAARTGRRPAEPRKDHDAAAARRGRGGAAGGRGGGRDARGRRDAGGGRGRPPGGAAADPGRQPPHRGAPGGRAAARGRARRRRAGRGRAPLRPRVDHRRVRGPGVRGAGRVRDADRRRRHADADEGLLARPQRADADRRRRARPGVDDARAARRERGRPAGGRGAGTRVVRGVRGRQGAAARRRDPVGRVVAARPGRPRTAGPRGVGADWWPCGPTATPPRASQLRCGIAGGAGMSIESPTLGGRLQGWPPFIRELDATLSVHSQYVLSGNLYDSFLTPAPDGGGHAQLLPLRALLWETLRSSGAAFMAVYDPVDGIQIIPGPGDPGGLGDEAAQAAERLLGKIKPDDKPSLEALTRLLAAVARPKENIRAAFVIDSASRIARTPTDLEPAERDFFRFCAKLSRTARP